MTILPEFGSVFGIGKNIRNIKNYWLWIQAALPNPVIKVMLTTAPTPRNLTHGYFLFYSDSYLEEEKSVTYWPVQIPTYAHFTYEEVELTHFINVRAGVKAESKPQRVNPNSSSYFRVSPCCLFRLTLCWQKEKKVSQSNYVIPVNNDSLKPAFDVLPAPRLSVQEVLSGLFPRGVFWDGLLIGCAGKEPTIDTADTLPFPKDSTSLDDASFPDGEQEKGPVSLQDHSSIFPGQDDPWESYRNFPAGSVAL